MRLPDEVAGLPPASTPTRPVLFVYALSGYDISTEGMAGPRPRAHKELGIWSSAGRAYEGIIVSFFKNPADARTSMKNLAWSYGGTRLGNVVATWDQEKKASGKLRNSVFGCLRANAPPAPKRSTPRATLATFAGLWGGHTRGLRIAPSGRGGESANDGRCQRVYTLAFRILSVRGTLTRATTTYRVTAFRRYERGVKKLTVGELGKLLLRNGIVTNTLTRDYFCSDPAWGATDACGL